MSGTDYDDLDLSEEEMAALEDNEDTEDQEDQDADDDVQDQEADEDAESEGDDSDADDDTDQEEGDQDSGGDESEDQSGDSEDDADQDGKEGDQKDGAEDDEPGKDAGDDAGAVADDQIGTDAQYEEKIKALDERLDNGELDFDEYKKEFMTLERSRTQELVRQEMARTKAEETWQNEQAEFFGENAYLKDNQIVYDAFARKVNALLEDKTWANKPGTDVLAEAKKVVDKAFGIKPAKEKPAPKEKTDGQKAVDKAKQSRAKKGGPKTLKDVPASDDNSDGAFEHLDNLDGPALEAAVAKMTPEEQEAWAESL